MEPIVFMPTRTLYVMRLVAWMLGIGVGVWIAVLDAQRSSLYVGAVVVIGFGILAVRSVLGMFSDTPQLVVTGEGFHVLGAMPVMWSEVAAMDEGTVVLGRRITDVVIRVWLHDPQDYVGRAIPSVARRAAANVAAGNAPITISPPFKFLARNAREGLAEMGAALLAGYDYASDENTVTDASTHV